MSFVRTFIPLPVRRVLGGALDSVARRFRRRWMLYHLRGNVVECCVCGWKGREFTDDAWHQGTICPSCRSDVRHRLLMAAWKFHPEWKAAQTLDGKHVLHFAPERVLRGHVQRCAAVYEAADFLRTDVDWKVDMSSMPSMADGAFDTVIACDVLEHVPDDRAAMRECHRILTPGGVAILTAPQKDPPARTDEDPAVRSEAERLQRFGQKDHLRVYGDDLALRMEEVGFKVSVVSAKDFTPADVQRFVLTPPVDNPHPLATNKRRLYFCRK